MGCKGQSPDRSSRTCPAPFPCRVFSSVPLIPVPPPPTHPPTDDLFCSIFTTLLRSWSYTVYPRSQAYAQSAVTGAVGSPPAIEGVRTRHRHRRRRQYTSNRRCTHTAPSPTPSAVHPRSQAYAQGAVTGAVGSAPEIAGVGARRRHWRRQESLPRHTVSESARSEKRFQCKTCPATTGNVKQRPQHDRGSTEPILTCDRRIDSPRHWRKRSELREWPRRMRATDIPGMRSGSWRPRPGIEEVGSQHSSSSSSRFVSLGPYDQRD